jgi:hypothetical protein
VGAVDRREPLAAAPGGVRGGAAGVRDAGLDRARRARRRSPSTRRPGAGGSTASTSRRRWTATPRRTATTRSRMSRGPCSSSAATRCTAPSGTDRSATVRSHGCVNLGPSDARWLFFWTTPFLPEGWHGVNATDESPGSDGHRPRVTEDQGCLNAETPAPLWRAGVSSTHRDQRGALRRRTETSKMDGVVGVGLGVAEVEGRRSRRCSSRCFADGEHALSVQFGARDDAPSPQAIGDAGIRVLDARRGAVIDAARRSSARRWPSRTCRRARSGRWWCRSVVVPAVVVPAVVVPSVVGVSGGGVVRWWACPRWWRCRSRRWWPLLAADGGAAIGGGAATSARAFAGGRSRRSGHSRSGCRWSPLVTMQAGSRAAARASERKVLQHGSGLR